MNGSTVNQAGIAVPAAKPNQAHAVVLRARRNRSWLPAVCARPVAARATIPAMPAVAAAVPAIAPSAAARPAVAVHLAAAAHVAPPAAAAAPAPHGFPVPTPILRS
ncbi:hypothetical protein GORBP_080_00010 [Gordonia rubripertincta NBRC 101908]|uniref:Uncharacterized protein n=1 Tax=Gordonia rubripertincta NBRC 101908 TaxID=1077975 RepID=A0ABQ0HWQ5_GORRU|nr:hypothetical protein GORBP_080_00010 [Gordonia rubripertincta NBRC 101908]